MKKPLRWDPEKNKKLKTERDIGFEEIKNAIDSGGLLDEVDHPNKKKYPNQKIYVVKYKEYIYLVPFVEDEQKCFLKTLYKSRKETRKYLGRKEQ